MHVIKIKIFLLYLQLLIIIYFVSITCILQCQVCFSKGCFSCCLWNICSHVHIFIQHKNMCLCNVKNSMAYCFYTRKDMGVENELYVTHILQSGPACGWGPRARCWLRGGAKKVVTDRRHVNTQHCSMVISSFANEKSCKEFFLNLIILA
jgi:hypothetical protein